MSSKKTAWHPPFTDFLQQRRPRWVTVTGEVQLSAEPLRVDNVLELWASGLRDLSDTGLTLHSMWQYVIRLALLEYKSIVWPFHHGDMYRLLTYGFLWLATHQERDVLADGSRSERLTPSEVTLILTVPSINKALRDELGELKLTLPLSTTGYYLLIGLPMPFMVVDLGAVAQGESDDLLGFFAGQVPHTLASKRWVRQHLLGEGTNMTMNVTPDLDGYEEFVASTLAMFTPEQLARALTPEQHVQSLTPAQRLAGLPAEELAQALTPEQRLLSLPDDALRALSDDYVASLPDVVQSIVRARRRR